VHLEEGKEKRLRYLNRSGMFSEVGQGQELDFPVITGVLDQRMLMPTVWSKGAWRRRPAAC
jgi:cell division protein FtsQ